MNPTEWHWGTWTETISLGSGELKSIALAHAIILGIAVIRYLLIPRLRGGGPGANLLDPSSRSSPPDVTTPPQDHLPVLSDLDSSERVLRAAECSPDLHLKAGSPEAGQRSVTGLVAQSGPRLVGSGNHARPDSTTRGPNGV